MQPTSFRICTAAELIAHSWDLWQARTLVGSEPLVTLKSREPTVRRILAIDRALQLELSSPTKAGDRQA